MGTQNSSARVNGASLYDHKADPGGQTNRLRFWEFDHFLVCPVIGTCLTDAEQRQLIKKAGLLKKKANPFEIHDTLVASSEDENTLSVKIDNLLTRKFKREALPFAGMGPDELMGQWRDFFDAGDHRAILWEIASRPEVPPEYRREVFGTIHMAMHGNLEAQAWHKQQLLNREQTIEKLQQELKRARQDRRTSKKENNRLSAENARLEARFAIMEQEKREMEKRLSDFSNQCRTVDFQAENERLNARLANLEAEAGKKNRRIESLKKRNNTLSDKLKQQKELNHQYREEAEWMIDRFSEFNTCDQNCPSYDLCKKRILIVGGITRMESLYRQLIEGRGGLMEHHDGYMKNGVRSLEGQLKRSDLIICPVSCNSHAACTLVKNLGKKHRKPVYMVANPSLNAVPKVIWILYGEYCEEGWAEAPKYSKTGG